MGGAAPQLPARRRRRQCLLSAPAPPLLVLGSVGTDHHPFDRLVSWLDAWAARQAPGAVRCLVQTGTSAPPTHAESVALLRPDELADLLRRASVVVCHGGPGTIMDCRRAGLRPVSVPRRQELGEHVDDHQLVFTRRVAQAGLVELAEDEDTLHRHLDAALARPDLFRTEPHDGDSNAATIARIGRLVGELTARPRSRRALLPLRWADR